MQFPRASGVLLHPTSLPGPFGIGDFGIAARRFVDFLAGGRQALWQVLPLGPTGYGGSPYAGDSAFAGNTFLISPERLFSDGLLGPDDLDQARASGTERVDFEEVGKTKRAILKRAFANYGRAAQTTLRESYQTFVSDNEQWLEDYALFQSIKLSQNGSAWPEWEPALARREEAALVHAREDLHDEIEAQKFYQFLFFKQWRELKTYANQRGVKIIGDVPIFVAHDSADVWAHRQYFKLENNGAPKVVAGVPPDYFSATGQYWGNPIYDWEVVAFDRFRWWIERIRSVLRMVDIARIDHFRGFAACWEIPAGETTAERGEWVAAPGRELFETVRGELGELPIVAEDLGVITPEVQQLRDDFGFPGMRVLQFGFSGDAQNIHLPHNYTANSVVYTGTHDNDTTRGWFDAVAGDISTLTQEQLDAERNFCRKYLDTDGAEINWDFIRTALASVAAIAIVPLQDVLGLGSEARMNLPNTTAGNWTWRFDENELTTDRRDRLRELTETYGRG